MEEATLKQAKVLDYIRDFINQNSYSPTVREIADTFAMSVKGAADHVQALKRKGYIASQERKSRTIKILKNGDVDAVENTIR